MKSTCLKLQQLPAEDLFFFFFVQQMPWYLWVMPSLPLPPQALLPCEPLFFGEGSLLGAYFFSWRLLLGRGVFRDDEDCFLGLTLSCNTAASCLFASSASFSAISLSSSSAWIFLTPANSASCLFFLLFYLSALFHAQTQGRT